MPDDVSVKENWLQFPLVFRQNSYFLTPWNIYLLTKNKLESDIPRYAKSQSGVISVELS